MDTTKWRSKFLSLMVAVALIISMVGVIALPTPVFALAQLGVSVTATNTSPCCCDTFNVTATITNFSTSENATDVNATLSWTPSGANSLVELDPDTQPLVQSIGNITAENSTSITWTCTA